MSYSTTWLYTHRRVLMPHSHSTEVGDLGVTHVVVSTVTRSKATERIVLVVFLALRRFLLKYI